MSNVITIFTATGRALLASAVANGQALASAKLAVGDGNGQVYVPNEAQVALVHETWRGAASVARTDDLVVFTATIPAGVGDFVVREVGLYLGPAGAEQLFIVSQSPSREKIAAPANGGASMDVSIHFSASAAQVAVLPTASALDGLNGFCVIESAQVANPPANPALGANYIVAANATGAWVGLTDKLVRWNGQAWMATDPRPGFVVVAQDRALDHAERWLRRAAGGWVSARAAEDALGVVELASAAEVLAGVDATRAVTPASLSARVASETVAGLVRKATPAEVRSRAAVAAYISPDQAPGLSRIVDATSAAVTVTAADAGTLFYQYGTNNTTFTLRPCTELAPAIGGAARGCAFFGFSNNNGTGDVIVRMTPGGGSICGLSVAGPQTSLTLKAGESITMLCDGANMWVTWSQPSIEARIRQSRDGTGYQVLPGGLVEMWGSTVVTTESYGNSALALPLTCPGGVKNVLAFNGDYNAHPDAIISEFTVGYPTAGAIAIHASNASGAALANTTLRIRWRALGAMS